MIMEKVQFDYLEKEQMSDFYKRVNDLYKTFKISEKEVLKAIDMPQATYSNFLKGKYIPNFVFAFKVASYFEVSIRTLIGKNFVLKRQLDDIEKKIIPILEEELEDLAYFLKITLIYEKSQYDTVLFRGGRI